jgi:hypothetical protein
MCCFLAIRTSGALVVRARNYNERRDFNVSPVDEHILSILGDTLEACSRPEIAEPLNEELSPDSAYTAVESPRT